MHIIITRHGESKYNLENRIGGDPSLSAAGHAYGQRLASFCSKNEMPKVVFCSTKKRAIQTVRYCMDTFNVCKYCPELDEIDAGICEMLTYEEFESTYPEEFARRQKDKLNYRYPSGESYTDLFKRTLPFITEILGEKTVFIVCHQAIVRALLYHLTDIPVGEIPYYKVPLHHILSLKGKPGQMTITPIKVEK